MKKCVCLFDRKCFYCETRDRWELLSADQKEAGLNLAKVIGVPVVDKSKLRLAIQKANELKVDFKMIPLEMF